jgi:Txe/YoeB family toxin of Txe-Axe toxin-antitoxin module
MDGNGRTGRILYHFLTSPDDGIDTEFLSLINPQEENDRSNQQKGRMFFSKKILAPERMYGYIYQQISNTIINPEFSNTYKRLVKVGQIGTYKLPIEVERKIKDKNLVRKFETIVSETSGSSFTMVGLVFLKFLNEKKILNDYSRVITRPNETVFVIDIENLVLELNAEDLQRIVEIHDEIKVLFVETLIS